MHGLALGLLHRLQAQHGTQVLARHHGAIAAHQRRRALQPQRWPRQRKCHQRLEAESGGRVQPPPATRVHLQAERHAAAQQDVERVGVRALVVDGLIPGKGGGREIGG